MTGLTVEQRIGMRVRAARTAAKMTQAELAQRIGLARTSIANLEAGRQDMGMSKLAVLAGVLRLDLGDLVRDGDLVPAPHNVTIRKVYDLECEQCNGIVDGAADHATAIARRREHIAQMQKAEAAS